MRSKHATRLRAKFKSIFRYARYDADKLVEELVYIDALDFKAQLGLIELPVWPGYALTKLARSG
ncbi:MAG: hypothetical protein OEM26_00730 [Saprospiraceae bacterium]|nr:hypothetical protein [Saprospiraceae bacterium]